MKKGWKIFLTVDGIVLALGIMLCFIGWAVGDKPSDITFYRNGWNIKDSASFYDEEILDDENGAVEFDAVDLNCKMGTLTIRGTDSDACARVSGAGWNTEVEVVEKDGLRVLTTKNDDMSLGEMTIYLPWGKELEYMKVSVGAGELDMEELSTRKLEVKVGAGDASLSNVTADDIVLECGMGSVEYEHDTLGITDFNYDLSCRMGEIEIGDAEYSGLNFSKKIDNSTNRDMKISCKAGDVNLSLEYGGWTDGHHAETYESHGKGEL